MQEEKELRKMAITQYSTEELQEELKKRTWSSEPTNRDLVSLIHGIFCGNPHEDSLDPCLYYDEVALETCWEEKYHKIWIVEAQTLMARLNLTTYEEFRILYLSVQDLLAKTKALSPEARALYTEISESTGYLPYV